MKRYSFIKGLHSGPVKDAAGEFVKYKDIKYLLTIGEAIEIAIMVSGLLLFIYK